MLPVPLAVNPLAPPAPTAVYVALVIAPGSASAICAPTALLGPAFVTTIVYVVAVPATTLATLSVLVIVRSAAATSASLSLTLAPSALAGSVTVTVLTMGLAVIAGSNATGTVNVKKLAAPAEICAPVVPKLVWPAMPVTVPHTATPAGTQVAVPLSVTPAGNGSFTVSASASDGPALVTLIVYVAVPPGV